MKILGFCVLIILIFSEPVSESSIQVPIEFFHSDCVVSCWQELEVGMSQDNLETSLHSMFDLFQTEQLTDGFTVFSKSNNNDYAVDAYVLDDVLVGLQLTTSHIFDVSLGQVIETLGQPEYHKTNDFSWGFDSYKRGTYLTLYYPYYGYIFTLNTQSSLYTRQNYINCIIPDLYTTQINIIASGDINDLIRNTNYMTMPNRANTDTVDDTVKILSRFDLNLCE